MKADEQALREAVLKGELPRAAGERLGIPSKRVVYLCIKWSGQGWYDYGVAPDCGFLTEAR